jgi:hypothetical protein
MNVIMLKHNEPNPLNIHGLRQVNHCPPHFTTVYFDLGVTEKDITDWLYENLEGRFYSGQVDVRQETGKYVRQQCIAFEHAAEASYFAMFLPQINQGEYLDL